MDYMDYIFWGIIIFIIVLVGIILPTLKRMRCTEVVNGTITDKREVLLSNGHGLYRRTKGHVSYFYNGTGHTVTMFIQFKDSSYVKLRINPKNPKEWVKDSNNDYRSCIIFTIVLIVLVLIIALLK